MAVKKQLHPKLLSSIGRGLHAVCLRGVKANMKIPKMRAAACLAILGVVYLIPSGSVFAQAPAGPMTPTHPLPPPPAVPPPKKRPELESRKTLAGFWKLNRDESDDPGKKLEEARQTKADPNGGPGGGNGRVGVGFPYPGSGGNGPYGGRGRGIGGEDTGTSERIQQLIRPDYSQSIEMKDAEVDVTSDIGHKLVYYTDGRKIQKSKDDSLQAVSARWDGTQLVTDEKGPQGRKMSRALELSPDGKHFYETWHVENGRSGTIVVRYVFDAAKEYE